ncbi:MFS transporter [Cryptosporangium aurantiacum]|uniref:Major Facilitator Superfamily protein n=1 Tax=Cryptosporangium aurantiacum TaxID=134849 RepID=A0A1M7PDM9_9ACTN|nr:MFS transporter [Cryptosporangium aurantiacum]SHN15064.1 Major Facilitator Superfamily protein [Cryptosporangium aurantiacum]
MTTDQPLLRDVPQAPPTAEPSRGFVALFALASLGLWIATLTPVIVSVPLKVAQIDPNENTQGTTLSVVLGIGAVFGILANPVFGRISDRTTWPLGRRRPWLVIGALLSVLGAVVLGLSSNVAVATVGWSINQIGVNATMAVLLALLPDQVPPERRGRISGLLGLTQAVAAVLGVALVGGLSQVSLTLAIIVPTAIALVCVSIAAVLLSDRPATRTERPSFNLREFAGSFWVNPRRFPDFGWAWISRFAMFMGISFALNYQIFYLTSHLGLTEKQATGLVPAAIGIQTLMVVLVSLTLGPLSDRLRRRKVFVLVSAVIAGVGLGVVALAPADRTSVPLFLLGMALVGLGQGTYFAVDLALVADVLPNKDEDAAKDLGVLGMANLIPQSIAPAVAPLFLAVPLFTDNGGSGQNYVALYLAGALFAVAAGVTILRVEGVR